MLRNYSPLTNIVAIPLNIGYYAALMLQFAVKRRPDLSKAMIDALWWNVKNIGD